MCSFIKNQISLKSEIWKKTYKISIFCEKLKKNLSWNTNEFPKGAHDAQTGHILCRAWRLCCVSPLLLSCLRASWLRLATSQAANSLRTIATVIKKSGFLIF